MTSIVIVGEAWGQEEAAKAAPFVGPSGQVLRRLLRQADITDFHLTNVFNLRPHANNIDTLCVRDKRLGAPGLPFIKRGYWLDPKYAPQIERLWAEIEEHRPKVIIALGNTALWALCHEQGIKKWRGFPTPTFDNRYKVIPSWHPAAVLRQWNLRPILYMDILKAKRESASSALIRPARKIVIAPTLGEIEEFYHEYIAPVPAVACDVETKGGQITEVGYAPSAKRALVIPFWCRRNGNYWSTLEDEIAAWGWVRRINSEKRLIGQNFSYDIQYFWKTLRIPCPIVGGDTMLMHHAMEPELEKSLAFLASIYTNEPAWKFMRTQNETLKKED